MNTPESCSTCKHWRPERKHGQCWRYPPRRQIVLTPDGTAEVQLAPITDATALCGEFTPKPLPPMKYTGEPDQKLRGGANENQ